MQLVRESAKGAKGHIAVRNVTRGDAAGTIASLDSVVECRFELANMALAYRGSPLMHPAQTLQDAEILDDDLVFFRFVRPAPFDDSEG